LTKTPRQESPLHVINSIEAFFEKLGSPIEDVTSEREGMSMIIGLHRSILFNAGL